MLSKKYACLPLGCDRRLTSGQVFALRDVFQQDYRFKVITQKLDTRSYPEPQAFRHLSNFVYEEDDENGLLIVYYAGHGGSEANEMGQISFTG